MSAPTPVLAPRCPVHRPERPKDCDRCRLRKNSRECVRQAALIAGTWEPMVDAAAAAEHCRKLRAAGMPYRAQAAVTGLARRHIGSIARGEIARLQPTTADALLSLTPPRGDEYSQWIDATGTRRRLTGLSVNGWSQATLAPRLGVSARAVGQMAVQSRVTRATADKIKALAEELYGLTGPAPEWTRQRLVKRGWVPLEYWGDDIDDPAAVPHIPDPDMFTTYVAQAVAGEWPATDLTRAERAAAVAELAGRGLSDREIAVRMRWVSRHGRPASDAVGHLRARRNIPSTRTPTRSTATAGPGERAA